MPSIDLDPLIARIGLRGGDCFEQNHLFAAVLEQLGFTVQRLAVRWHA